MEIMFTYVNSIIQLVVIQNLDQDCKLKPITKPIMSNFVEIHKVNSILKNTKKEFMTILK